MTTTTAYRATPANVRPSRAQFSPVSLQLSSRIRSADAHRSAASAALDFAERSFLNRWSQATLLDRLQPTLTRRRE